MIKDYLDKHRGRIAFVLGAGASLHTIPLELIQQHTTIAVNRAILKVPFAQYCLSCDTGFTLWSPWTFLKNLECKLLLNVSGGSFPHYDGATGVRAFDGMDEGRVIEFVMENKLMMDRDSGILIRGTSSVHSAVHFAHILGCSPIVLLGCDCEYTDGKKYFTDYPDELDCHFIKPEYAKLRKDFSGARIGTSDGELMGHFTCWSKISIQNPNVHIINASGGRLEVFPRMTVEEILAKYA